MCMERKLIVGLGNPDKKWLKTRHNIGWMVLESIDVLKWEEVAGIGFMAENVKGDIFLRPTVGMNSSGIAVEKAMKNYNIPVENVLIIVDDMDLPFGNIRLKGKGSARHNGLRSIEEHLGTSKYARLKVGIGKDFEPGQQLEFVLGEFKREEQLILPEIIEAVKSGIEVWLEEDTLEKAMSKIN